MFDHLISFLDLLRLEFSPPPLFYLDDQFKKMRNNKQII